MDLQTDSLDAANEAHGGLPVDSRLCAGGRSRAPRDVVRLGRWSIPVAAVAWAASLTAHGAVIVFGWVVLRHAPDQPPGVAFSRGNGGSGIGIYREGGSAVDLVLPTPMALSPAPSAASVADDEQWTESEFAPVVANFAAPASSGTLEPAGTDGVGFIGVPPRSDGPPAGMLFRPKSAGGAGGRATGVDAGAGNEGAASSGSPGVANGVADARLPAPVYPRESRLRGEQGTVVLELDIDSAGAVTAVHVIDASPYPRLATAAVTAAKKGRFVPATRAGKPVPSTVRIPFVFRLVR